MDLSAVLTIMTIVNLGGTIILASMLYRFSVRQAQIEFERDIKVGIQQINLAAISNDPILPYLQAYDVDTYELEEKEAVDIYYLYFELNIMRSFLAARKYGVADKSFFEEAFDERIWRILPYRQILEKMKSKGKNYSGSFLEQVLNRMDELCAR